jgi:hypothetical protein
MNRKFVIALTLIILSSSLCIKETFADVPANVSYTASRNVSYTGSLTQISFSITATLNCEVTYNNVLEGSTCHLSATPSSALLTINYHITRRLLADIDGTNSTQLPPQLLSGLVGDSQPIPISIGNGAGTITIVVHGKLIGQNLVVTQGSANPNLVQWSTWAPQNTSISSTNSQVTLKMDTEYDVSFTATVAIVGFDVASKDSTVGQFSGNISPTFAISLSTNPTPTPTTTPTPTSTTPTPTSASASTSPTPSPSIPEFPKTIMFLAAAAMFLIATVGLVAYRRHSSHNLATSPTF